MSGSRRVKVDILGDAKGAQKAFQAAGASADGFGTSIASLGKVVAAGLAAVGIGSFVVDAGKSFIQFEKGIREVFTLLPNASQDAMDAMGDQVKDFSREFSVLPEEVIPALYESLSSGVPEDTVFDFLETAQKAAVGGVTDLATVVNGLTSVINSYGADVLTAGQASDLMFTAVNLGKTTFAELSNSLYNVLPTTASLGVAFSDVTAAIAAMTAQGVPTSVATTQLRNVFIELSQAGGELSTTFEGLAGKSFKDFIAQGGNTQQALQLLEQHANDTGVSVSDLFSSVDAGAAALQLTGKGTAAFTDAMDAMGNAAGSTDSAYDVMSGSVQRSLEKLKVNFELIKLAVGERVIPIFAALLGIVNDKVFPALGRLAAVVEDRVAPVLSRFGEFLSGLRDAFDEGGFSGLVERAASGLASFATSVGSAILDGLAGIDWVGALGTVASKITGIATSVDWAGAGGAIWGALLTAMFALTEWGVDLATWIADVATGVDWAGTAGSIWGAITAAWFTLTEWGADFASWITSTVTGVDWVESATSIWGAIKSAWFALTEWGTEFASWVAGVVTGIEWTETATTIWNAIKSAWFAITEWGGEFVAWVVTAITSTDWSGAAIAIRDRIVEAANTVDWSAIGETISDAVKPPDDGGGWKQVFADILTAAEPLTSAISGGLTAAFVALGPTIRGVADAFGNLDIEGLQTIFTNFATTIGTIVAVAIIAVSKAVELLAPILSVVLPVAAQVLVTVFNVWIGVIETVSTAILGLVNTVVALLQGDWAGAWESAKGVVTGFASGVLGIFETFASDVWGIVGGLVTTVLGELGRWASEAPGIVSGFVSSVQGFLSDLVGEGTRLAGELVTGVIGKLGEMVSQAYTKASQLYADVVFWIGEVVSDATEKAASLPGAITSAVGDLGGILVEQGKAFVQGLIDGIDQMLGPLDEWVGKIGSLLGKIDIPGRSPVDHAGLEIGAEYVFNMGVGIESELGTLGTAVNRIGDTLGRVGQSIRDQEPDLKAAGSAAPRAVADGVEQGAQAAANTGYRAGRGITAAIMAGLDPDASKDEINAKWMDVIGGMDDILSGDAADRLNEQLRTLQEQIEWARFIGAPPDVIQQLQDQAAAVQADLALVGKAYSDAVAAGMVDAWTPEMAADMAAKMDKILDGSLAKQMQSDLDEMNARIAKATALGWNKELIDQWQAQANQMADDLAGVNSDMAAAGAAGLLDPAAQAAYDKAMGILIESPMEKWREALSIMGDDWVSMLDDLAADVASGAMTIDEAMSVLPEMTKEQADAVAEELRRLEAQFREELAQAVLDGTDEAKAAAKANLQAIIDMLAATGAAAAQTGTDVNAALTSLFAPSSSGDGSGGGGGGGGGPEYTGRGSSPTGMAGGGDLNLHPQWGWQQPTVNVYVGNEQVAAVVEAEQLAPVSGALLAEASS